jgi:hypothetical protein
MNALFSPNIDEVLVIRRRDRLMARAYLAMSFASLVFLGFVGVMWLATP